MSNEFRPPQWITDVIPRKSPFVPQMGDEVCNIQRGSPQDAEIDLDMFSFSFHSLSGCTNVHQQPTILFSINYPSSHAGIFLIHVCQLHYVYSLLNVVINDQNWFIVKLFFPSVKVNLKLLVI